MAYLELAVAFLVVHPCSIVEDVDSDSALVNRPAVVAVGVYTAAVVLVAKVALLGSEQLMHSEVVLDVVLHVVTDFACYLAH